MSKVTDVLGPDFKVIDADTHYSEPGDLWTKRAPAKYRDLVPQVKLCDDGRLRWFVDGDVSLGYAGSASVIEKDGHKRKYWNTDILNGILAEDAHPGSWSVKPRLEVMDEQGVYAQIVYPNVVGFGAGKILRLPDQELAATIVRIYNDAMAEWQEESGDRLLPQAMIPFWNIDAAVKEIERTHVELGMRGITMTGEPFAGGLPDLGDTHWDPMYQICTDLNIPINIHIGSGTSTHNEYSAHVWPSQDEYRKYVLMCVQIELANSNFLSNLVTSDVLVRWPETRWVSVESGIGWIPYVLERAEFQLMDSLPDDPALQRPGPTELFRKNVYSCFWFEQSGPKHQLEDVGVDNVLFESDFPHPTCLYPNPVEAVLETLKDHDLATIKKVMGENAAKLYGVN